MEENKLTKFIFYDLYYKALKDGTDERAGKLIRSICKVMFDNEEPELPADPKERFDWENLLNTLRVAKSIELTGRIPKTLNKKMRHYTFYDSYYSAIKLLNDADAGAYAKAICGYMLEEKEPKGLSPAADKYFGYVKWNMMLSKMRTSAGTRGGTKKTPPPVITLDRIKSEFGFTGEIYHQEEYLKGIDLCKAYEFFKINRPSFGKNIYRAFEEYKTAQKEAL